MNKILVIGTGNIGSRHLQSLARSKKPLEITAVDPNTQALELSRQRFDEVARNRSLQKPRYYQNIDDIDREFDVGIIATTSDVRRKVIEDLLCRTDTKHLILEKVAFQSREDFEYVIKLLRSRDVKAWVNCPRRIIPFYVELKKIISPHEQIFYTVEGGDWGLASNSIHFIDHISFLIEETSYQAYSYGLDNTIKASKRKGFIEFTGSFHGYFDNGSELSLISENNSNCPTLISIMTPSMLCIVQEQKGMAEILRKDKNWEWEEIKFKFYLQSELTYKVVEEILDTGNCGLTTLKESYLLHAPMLKAFTDHVQRTTNKEYSSCPIT